MIGAKRIASFTAIAALTALTSCGGGAVAVIFGASNSSSGSSGGGGGGGNGVVKGKPWVAEADLPSGATLRGAIPLRFRLVDAQGRRTDVRVRTSLDGGATFPHEPSYAPGSGPTLGLATSRDGVWHEVLWDSAADLPGERRGDLRLRVTPLVDGNPIGPNAGTTALFAIDNSAAPLVRLVAVRSSNGSATLHGVVEIELEIEDAEEDLVDVDLRAQRNGGAFSALDGLAAPLLGLASGLLGAPRSHRVAWSTALDVPGEATVLLRAEGRDTQLGPGSELGPLAVDNTTAEILASSFSPALPFDVVEVRYTLRDDGADPLDVEVLYSIDGSDPALVASFAEGRDAESPQGQSSSPLGEAHSFAWDAVRDLGAGATTSALRVRIRGRDARTGVAIVSAVLGPFAYDGTRVATAAGSPRAVLALPGALARDADGTLVFVDERESASPRIARLDPSSGVLSAIAGGGTDAGEDVPALEARIAPRELALDAGGDVWFLEGARVRRVRGARGIDPRVETYAGGGSSTADDVDRLQALFAPSGFAVESTGAVIVADLALGPRLRRIDPSTWRVSTLLLRDAAGLPVSLVDLGDVEVDAQGSLYFSEPAGQRVWYRDNVAVANRTFAIAGNGARGFSGDGGPATAAQLDTPHEVALDAAGRVLFHDSGNFRVRRISSASIATIAGGGHARADLVRGTEAELLLRGLAARGTRGAWISHVAGNTARLSEWSDLDARLRAAIGAAGPSAVGEALFTAPLSSPTDLLSPIRDLLFAIEDERRIVKLDRARGTIELVAGSGDLDVSGDGGPAAQAGMNPVALAYDGSDQLYCADRTNDRVRRVDLSTGMIETIPIALDPTSYPPPLDRVKRPGAIAIDAAGDLYLCDTAQHRVIKIEGGTYAATVIAGDGTAGMSGDRGAAISALLDTPRGVFLDGAGNVYVLDQGRPGFGSMRVRRIEVRSGVIDTVAGGGALEPDGVPATQANLRRLSGGIASGGFLLLATHALQPTGTFDPLAIVRVDLTRDLATRDCGVLAPGSGLDADGVPARDLVVRALDRISVGFDGEIYFSEPARGTLRRYVPEPLEPLQAPEGDSPEAQPATPAPR